MASNVKYWKEASVRLEMTVGASKSAGTVLALSDMPVLLLEASDSSNKALAEIIGVSTVVELSVVGETGGGNSAVAVGDRIYLDGTAYNKDSTNGQWIGYALETVSSGATASIDVGLVTTAINVVEISGLTASAAELNTLDGVTAGEVAASKALVVDANKDLAHATNKLRHVTATGTLTGAAVTATGAVTGATVTASGDVQGAGLTNGTNRIDWGTAAPSTGAHAQGDIVIDTNAAAGGWAGFYCTVAGTPGTWQEFGAIDAS